MSRDDMDRPSPARARVVQKKCDRKLGDKWADLCEISPLQGKFDPESQYNVRAERVIFDRSVKTFPREDRFDINFKGIIKISIHDNLSWCVTITIYLAFCFAHAHLHRLPCALMMQLNDAA